MEVETCGKWRAARKTVISLFILTVFAGGLLSACKPDTEIKETPPSGPTGQPALSLIPSTFGELPGWSAENFNGIATAFLRSCVRLTPQDRDKPLGPDGLAGTVSDWHRPCTRLQGLNPNDPVAVRAFFEAEFVPYLVTDRGNAVGLFTGYYEPELRGSLEPGGSFITPLYSMPSDLITVDLKDFRADLPQERLFGRVEGGKLIPYYDRAAIENGAIASVAQPVLWLEDAVDAFFLHVQGSGKVILPDGRVIRAGYAGSNGLPFYAIGKALIEENYLTQGDTSMQAIRTWLRQNPDEAKALMHRNRRFIFFRLIEGEGPFGAQGVVLTPTRSLAIDPAFLPLGMPLWLDTTFPGTSDPLQRLMVTQDTGNAIKGPIRGDFFWGAGEEALAQAGRMKQQGRYWLFLPVSVKPASQLIARAP